MRQLIAKLAGSAMSRIKRFAAVDFDSTTLRVALAEPTSDGTRIGKLLSQPLPEGLDVQDAKAFGRFLGKTLRGMGLSGAGIIMNVPRSQAVLKPLKLPPGTPEQEYASMVHFQVGKELPFPAEDAVIDFTVESHYGIMEDSIDHADQSESETETEPAPQPVDVLVSAVQMEVVDYYRQIAEFAGVKLLRLGLRPYANMRCVEACQAATGHQNIAIVHITADETEIDLISHHSLAFSRSALRKMAGIADATDVEISAAANFLVLEVARSLQSYQTIGRGGDIDIVLLAGGTGIEPQVARELACRLNRPCEILAPEKALSEAQPKEVASEFISVFGLSVRHPSEDIPFDFLNPKRPPVKRDIRKTRATAATIAGAVLLLICVAGGSMYLGAKRGTVTQLNNRLGELNRAIKAKKKTIERVKATDRWLRPKENWLDHCLAISACAPSAKDVYIKSFNGTPAGLRFNVQARSEKAIVEFDKKLQAAGYEFKAGKIDTGKDDWGYTYSTLVRVYGMPELDRTSKTAATQPVVRPGDDMSPAEFQRKAAGGKAAARKAAARTPRKATPRKMTPKATPKKPTRTPNRTPSRRNPSRSSRARRNAND